MRRFYGFVFGLALGLALGLFCDRITGVYGFATFASNIALGYVAAMALGAVLGAVFPERRVAVGAATAVLCTYVLRVLPLPPLNLVPLGGGAGPAGEVPGFVLPALGAVLGVMFGARASPRLSRWLDPVIDEMSPWPRRVRIAGVTLAIVSGLWQLSLETRLYAARVRYPWDIEWLESAWLYQGYRVMHGLPIFGPPRDGFLPQLHPLGYPALLGVLGRLVGIDYGMARTLSFLMFLGSGLLILRALVRKHENRMEGWALGAFAMGCAAAGAPMAAGFYDLVRPDMMAVALSVLGAALVGSSPRMSPRRIAILAAVLTAILFTRLPAVFFVVWIGVYVLLRDKRTGVLLALAVAGLAGIALVAVQLASHGWYWTYTVGLYRGHAIIPQRIATGFDVLARLGPLLAPLPLVVAKLAGMRRLSADTTLWVGMLGAAILASLLPFAKVGGFSNDFLPMAFMIGPATAFVAADAIAAFEGRPRAQLTLQTLLFAAGAAFLCARTWDLAPFTPSADTFRDAQALNARVASLQGGVVSPRDPFLPIHNGHTTLQWSEMPYIDMRWAHFTDLDLDGYVDRAQPRWALVSGTETGITARVLSDRFQLEERLPDSPVTLVGDRNVMRYLLRANDDEKDGRVLFDFESREGWTVTGDAFFSRRPTDRDEARGTMVSPAFVIDRPRMSLRVGGGFHDGTRAELRVEGHTERTAIGIWEEQDTLVRVVWDVSTLQGRTAQLWLVDDDPRAHLICDRVVLY